MLAFRFSESAFAKIGEARIAERAAAGGIASDGGGPQLSRVERPIRVQTVQRTKDRGARARGQQCGCFSKVTPATLSSRQIVLQT